jgi:PHD/YefM family antitoxin component YafN of YafNO toxin-antitoxin module
MQYILSEEEYQRYQDALKDAEAARSDEAKLAKYLAARDRVHLDATSFRHRSSTINKSRA